MSMVSHLREASFCCLKDIVYELIAILRIALYVNDAMPPLLLDPLLLCDQQCLPET